jgi:ankyrin repeat protein
MKLLIEADADLNSVNKKGQSALIISARKGSLEHVKLLIASKAKLDIVDEQNLSALDYANQQGHDSVSELLV